MIGGTLLFCLPLVSIADDAVPGVYTDLAKTFTVAAPDPWVRQIKLERKKRVIALFLSLGPATEDQNVPSVVIMKISEFPGQPSDLDAVAASLAKKAKDNHADQGVCGKVERIKVDGVDARSVEYLLEDKKALLHFKTRVASRSGKLYVIQFFSLESDYKDKAPGGESILDSLHWSDPNGKAR
jgi:hypothetical protein